MSFFHWFRKKSPSTEAEGKPSGTEESSPDFTTLTQTTSGTEGQETASDTPSIGSIGQQSASPPVMPLSTAASPRQPASATPGPSPTPHFFVPIGAFYEKLPPHLVAPERPDLTRLVEIAEEDVVIEQEAQEATVPLSILSLSCPDIFVRPVADSDEIPITFFLNRQLSPAVAVPSEQSAAQPPENAIQAREAGNVEVPAGVSVEGAGRTIESVEVKPQLTETAPVAEPDQTGLVKGRSPATVRATTATGKIRLSDMTAPVDELVPIKESGAGATASAAPFGGVEFSGPADSTERGIRLRLEPILSNFPLDLEQPSIRALSETRAEIVLPLDVIQSQLPQGRVVVSAAMFCRALPNNLKPYFEAIEPTAEIPIPLREIFERLPPEVIKLREDQEIDYPETPIETPFSRQTEEDAKRLGPAAATTPGPSPTPDREETPAPDEAATPGFSSSGLQQGEDEGDVSSPPLPLKSEMVDSERLHAIFMTDETLDLAKTIRMVGELPGLRACLLSATDGLKIAGNLDDPSQEQAISALMPDLFEQARSKLEGMHLGRLETITLHCGRDQLSTFVHEKFCLTVLHDKRPFKPGVREKVQAVIRELVSLSAFGKEP